ncbi:MAG TPA: RluA family pseudouridine synthase [Planctomycetaceae bacterium]|nr:RluA family pseudouridine synthase [Planctomycetaceae bacterium]
MPIIESQCTVTARQIGRIDRVVQELTGRSRGDVKGLFDHDCVRLNGQVCPSGGTVVAEADLVVVRHDPHSHYRLKPRQRDSTSSAYRLVFEDRDLIVVDKAAAILTVPTDRGETNTLLDALVRSLGRRGHRGRVSVVHRLDRGTSGLLVFGKNPPVARELQAQFRVRKADREYAALVAGRVEHQSGTFDNRLRTTKSLQRYSVDRDAAGERAVTHYRVARRFTDATYVRVTLETGKRNQIRVHFAEVGHPVLGDERYAVETARHPAWKYKRLALHATLLGFEHPRTHQRLRFESPLPSEFESFFKLHGS